MTLAELLSARPAALLRLARYVRAELPAIPVADSPDWQLSHQFAVGQRVIGAIWAQSRRERCVIPRDGRAHYVAEVSA